MSKEIEQALDQAYTEGPFYVVEMPFNADGHGPEMDPAKVAGTQWEVWNPLHLSLGHFSSKGLADWAVTRFNGPDIEKRADLVARQLFLLTTLPPSFCAAIGLLVKYGEHPDNWASGAVDAQLILGGSPGRTADDVANFCADFIEAEAPEAAARLRGFFR